MLEHEPVVPMPPVDRPFSQVSPPGTFVSGARQARGPYDPQLDAVWQSRVRVPR